MSKIWDAVLGLRRVCFLILKKAFSFKCFSARVKFLVWVKRVPKWVYC